MPTYPVTGTVTGTGGETTLKSDELEFLDTEIIYYDVAPTTINVGTFTVPSPGGSYTFTINAPVLPNTTHWKHGGTLATVNFLAPASAGTVTFTVQPTTVAEGSDANFTITTQDIEPGSALGWRLVHVGVVSNNSHYATSPGYGIVGSIILSNSAVPTGSFKVKPLIDGVTNPPGFKKEFKIEITKGGVVIASSNTIEVTESSSVPGSLGPIYALALSPTSVNEGGTVTGTITVTNPINKATNINWSLVDISSPYDSAPNNYFSTNGSVTIPANATTATFNISVYEDKLVSPGKTFKVKLTDSDGLSLLTTAVGPVTVNDTSKPTGAEAIASGGALTVSTMSGAYYNYGATGGWGVGLPSGSTLVIIPDGRWEVLLSNGSKYQGNWFTPTTPQIGSNYYIKAYVSSGPFYSGLGGNHTSGIDLVQLRAVESVGAYASGYNCVDPETEILVDSDGTTRLAADLEVGDEVYTMHEFSNIWGYFKVLNHEIVTQPKLLLTFTDGTTLTASKSHKIYQGKNTWKAIENLVSGERLVTFSGIMKELLSIEDIGDGLVVSMEIENAHTYVAADIVSHNIKAHTSDGHHASIYVDFTIEISIDQSGAGMQTAIVSLGGEVGIQP